MTVKTILQNEVYIGHMVQNKTGTVSYKIAKKESANAERANTLKAEMSALDKRLAELEKLIQAAYEDKVMGRIPESVCIQLLNKYEAEQEWLKTEIAVTEEWLDLQQENTDHYDRFAALVEKYVDIPELTTGIVNEFIKKIIVHEADKSTGRRRQTVEIIFNFVGQVEIPILTDLVTTETPRTQRKTA